MTILVRLGPLPDRLYQDQEAAPRWGGCRSPGAPGALDHPGERRDNMRAHIIRQLVALNLTESDDTARHELVAGIQQSAPTSQLYLNNPALQVTFAALVKADGALSTLNTTVAGDKQKLRADTASETTARGVEDGLIRTYVAQTEALAASPADVIAVGLPYRAPVVITKLPPAVPVNVGTRIPKVGHGKVIVEVNDVTASRTEYVAQSSPNPIATWTQLGIGHGKTRAVTGPSGTQIWVRLAAVRGQLQSDWSTPILVTIP
jgi:hypothetical protein